MRSCTRPVLIFVRPSASAFEKDKGLKLVRLSFNRYLSVRLIRVGFAQLLEISLLGRLLDTLYYLMVLRRCRRDVRVIACRGVTGQKAANTAV